MHCIRHIEACSPLPIPAAFLTSFPKDPVQDFCRLPTRTSHGHFIHNLQDGIATFKSSHPGWILFEGYLGGVCSHSPSILGADVGKAYLNRKLLRYSRNSSCRSNVLLQVPGTYIARARKRTTSALYDHVVGFTT